MIASLSRGIGQLTWITDRPKEVKNLPGSGEGCREERDVLTGRLVLHEGCLSHLVWENTQKFGLCALCTYTHLVPVVRRHVCLFE